MFIDIDNCLIDSRCQQQYLPPIGSPREAWDEFQKHSGEYKRNALVDGMIWDNIMLNDIHPIFITAREDIRDLRKVTEDILFKLFGETPHHLYMRKENDYRSDVEVKADLYPQILKDFDNKIHVVFAIDDKQEICELWQSKGIPTLQFRFGEATT
jgi:hypothetical protein